MNLKLLILVSLIVLCYDGAFTLQRKSDSIFRLVPILSGKFSDAKTATRNLAAVKEGRISQADKASGNMFVKFREAERNPDRQKRPNVAEISTLKKNLNRRSNSKSVLKDLDYRRRLQAQTKDGSSPKTTWILVPVTVGDDKTGSAKYEAKGTTGSSKDDTVGTTDSLKEIAGGTTGSQTADTVGTTGSQTADTASATGSKTADTKGTTGSHTVDTGGTKSSQTADTEATTSFSEDEAEGTTYSSEDITGSQEGLLVPISDGGENTSDTVTSVKGGELEDDATEVLYNYHYHYHYYPFVEKSSPLGSMTAASGVTTQGSSQVDSSQTYASSKTDNALDIKKIKKLVNEIKTLILTVEIK